MIRRRILAAMVLVCTFSVTAFGDDSGESTEPEIPVVASDEGEDDMRPSYLRDRFQFTVNAGVGFSKYQWQFSGGLQADFNANPFLGIGLKSTVDYGFKYNNLNVNLFLLYKIWWFYAGPGVSFIVQDMTLPPGETKYAAIYSYNAIASIALTAGTRFPVARIGPGFLTVDISVDWYQTDILLSKATPPLTGSTITELLNGSIYAFKVAARLGYTF